VLDDVNTIPFGYTVLSTSVTPAPTPDISVSPINLDLGLVTIDTASVPQTVTITNTGDIGSVLVINPITVSQAFAFNIFHDTCSGKSLPQGQSCTLDDVFAPTVTGLQQSTLSITSNAQEFSVVKVALTGEGNDQAQCEEDLGMCTQELAQCETNLTTAQTALAQCETNLGAFGDSYAQ
jgi:hypothetical protein